MWTTGGGRLDETTSYDGLTVMRYIGIVGIYTSCRYTTRLYRQLTSLSPVLAIVNRLNTTYVAHVYILGVYMCDVGANESGDNLLKLKVAYVKESLRAASSSVPVHYNAHVQVILL